MYLMSAFVMGTVEKRQDRVTPPSTGVLREYTLQDVPMTSRQGLFLLTSSA